MAPQNIFLGEDIRKQLPSESALFDQINSTWKSVMDRMNKDSNALRATHHPGLSSSTASGLDRARVGARCVCGSRGHMLQRSED